MAPTLTSQVLRKRKAFAHISTEILIEISSHGVYRLNKYSEYSNRFHDIVPGSIS